MGRTTQSPELYISTVSPHWKCNLILYTSQACLPTLPGPVPIQYSTPHTLPSAVTSETWKMSSPYSNLSTEVQTAITELESDSSTYKPQNANELLKIVDSVQIFFVTGDGHVSTFSAPETLRIFKFQEDQEDSTTSFLQVGGLDPSSHPRGLALPPGREWRHYVPGHILRPPKQQRGSRLDRVRQPRPEESADVSPGETDCSQEPDVVTPRAPTGRARGLHREGGGAAGSRH